MYIEDIINTCGYYSHITPTTPNVEDDSNLNNRKNKWFQIISVPLQLKINLTSTGYPLKIRVEAILTRLGRIRVEASPVQGPRRTIANKTRSELRDLLEAASS
jgi:hypothetical protein